MIKISFNKQIPIVCIKTCRKEILFFFAKKTLLFAVFYVYFHLICESENIHVLSFAF